MVVDYSSEGTGDPDPAERAAIVADHLSLRAIHPAITPVYTEKAQRRRIITWISQDDSPVASMSFRRTSDGGWLLGGVEYCS